MFNSYTLFRIHFHLPQYLLYRSESSEIPDLKTHTHTKKNPTWFSSELVMCYKISREQFSKLKERVRNCAKDCEALLLQLSSGYYFTKGEIASMRGRMPFSTFYFITACCIIDLFSIFKQIIT